MLELVYWSFVITLPPFLLSIGLQVVSALSTMFATHDRLPVVPNRHARPAFPNVTPRGMHRPEGLGHGI